MERARPTRAGRVSAIASVRNREIQGKLDYPDRLYRTGPHWETGCVVLPQVILVCGIATHPVPCVTQIGPLDQFVLLTQKRSSLALNAGAAIDPLGRQPVRRAFA